MTEENQTSNINQLVVKTNHLFKTYNEYKAAYDTFHEKEQINREEVLKSVGDGENLTEDELIDKVLDSAMDSLILDKSYANDLLIISNNFVLSVEDTLLVGETLSEEVMYLYNLLKEYTTKTQYVVLKDGTLEAKEKDRVAQIKDFLKNKIDIKDIVRDLSNKL